MNRKDEGMIDASISIKRQRMQSNLWPKWQSILDIVFEVGYTRPHRTGVESPPKFFMDCKRRKRGKPNTPPEILGKGTARRPDDVVGMGFWKKRMPPGNRVDRVKPTQPERVLTSKWSLRRDEAINFSLMCGDQVE